MDDRPPTIHPYPSFVEAAASTNLTTILHSLVPPYFLTWGLARGVGYALVSLTGFLCHISFMAYIIASLIREGLDELIDSVALPVRLAATTSAVNQGLDWLADTVALSESLVLSVISWWFVSSIWMAFMYKRHHDGTSGWRAYIFGGGWAWAWRRGNSGADSDSDFDFD